MLSPFCSCSVIPILMGFLASGVPLPLCLAFLTSASCMNLTALTTLFAQMDLRFSALYLACCLAICALSSVLVGARGAEGLVRLDKLHAEHHHHHDENTARSRLVKALCSGLADVPQRLALPAAGGGGLGGASPPLCRRNGSPGR